MADEDLLAAHKLCANHRAQVLVSDVCGCFHCQSHFLPRDVSEWVDEGQTALCPECGVDAVIGSASGIDPSDPRFLARMHYRWFQC
ncbi:MAG: cytoplasmic protein [Paracoccaceae bacterium]|nr:cytoplasmic protein [Paracoccaceae bacterium]